MGNWEKKSAYLLREIVKFRTYIDSLAAAQSRREDVYRERAERVQQSADAATARATAKADAAASASAAAADDDNEHHHLLDNGDGFLSHAPLHVQLSESRKASIQHEAPLSVRTPQQATVECAHASAIHDDDDGDVDEATAEALAMGHRSSNNAAGDD